MLKNANLLWTDVAYEQAVQWLEQFKPANEEKAKPVAEPKPLEMHELTCIKGSVHDQGKKCEVVRLNFDYPGNYLLQISFAKTWLPNPDIFEPNLDISAGHDENDENNVWLGDIDAAFDAKSLTIRVNYLGYGRYEINNHYFDQNDRPVHLFIDAFDTNNQWIQFEVSAKEAL